MNNAIRNLEEQVSIQKTYAPQPTTDNTRITTGTRRPDDTPSRDESFNSSVITDKPQGQQGPSKGKGGKEHYNKGKVRRGGDPNQKNNDDNQKSGNCNTGCNLF